MLTPWPPGCLEATPVAVVAAYCGAASFSPAGFCISCLRVNELGRHLLRGRFRRFLLRFHILHIERPLRSLTQTYFIGLAPPFSYPLAISLPPSAKARWGATNVHTHTPRWRFQLTDAVSLPTAPSCAIPTVREPHDVLFECWCVHFR